VPSSQLSSFPHLASPRLASPPSDIIEQQKMRHGYTIAGLTLLLLWGCGGVCALDAFDTNTTATGLWIPVQNIRDLCKAGQNYTDANRAYTCMFLFYYYYHYHYFIILLFFLFYLFTPSPRKVRPGN
jgi:hypothetical protein